MSPESQPFSHSSPSINQTSTISSLGTPSQRDLEPLLNTEELSTLTQTSLVEVQELNEMPPPEEWLFQYGYNSYSFFSLYPGIKHYTQAGLNGFIPYMESSKLILAVGDPICDPQDLEPLVKGFIDTFKPSAKSHGRRLKSIGFLPVTEKIASSLKHLGFDCLYVGKEPIINLNTYQPLTPQRNPKSYLDPSEYSIEAFHPETGSNSAQAQSIESEILALSKQGPQQNFLAPFSCFKTVSPLTSKEHKRFYLLMNSEKQLMGYLSCLPIYERNGWLFETILTPPNARPKNSLEISDLQLALIHFALQSLAAEGFEKVSFGLAPFFDLPLQDTSHPIYLEVFKTIQKLQQLLQQNNHTFFPQHFPKEADAAFKKALHPDVWESQYFCVMPSPQKVPILGLHLIDLLLIKSF
ncbi:MAG: DUF2156 domain-containing protein [Cyanobacteria bacterium]|nr:DUF2156 domain-containing protein [Cyanobacteriota bacterium]